MNALLKAFSYIQKYYDDPLDVLFLTLRFLAFCKDEKAVQKALKKSTEVDFTNDFVALHEKLNIKKVLKTLQNTTADAPLLQDFIKKIALQKTILKLYSYATPSEINALVCEILDIKKGESVFNPCCGLGSWLISLSEVSKDCKFYGVDIEPKLIAIANVIKEILSLESYKLEVLDILKANKLSKNAIFDKVFCHPPLLFHLNIQAPKEAILAPFNKTTPEIPFLDFALQRFSKKAVFIARSFLLNKGAKARLCAYLLESKMLEAIIELPQNIYPYQTEDFSLLVLSPNNERVLLINAKEFCLKEGKYNKLINTDELLDLYASKQNTRISQLLSYKDLSINNLLPSFYMSAQNKNELKLQDLLERSFRGNRLEIRSDCDLIPCYDLGIKDFSVFSYTEHFVEYSLKPNSKRINELKIAPFDLLLSMRGVLPKIAIIGENLENKIILANAGILVLRFKNKEVAKALYFYFLSKAGQKCLETFYKSHFERVSEKEINTLELPSDFLDENFIKKSVENFEKLHQQAIELAHCKAKINELLGF